jgi:hypothetical protein
MKTNAALLWLGLFTLAGAVTTSCGGTSDDGALFTGGTTGSNAGTAGMAGAVAVGGTTPIGGTTSHAAGTNSAGTNNSSAGTTSGSAGTTSSSAGTTNNSAGTANNTGGRSEPGTGGAPGPDAGGAGTDGCPATMPDDGATCMQGDSPFEGCDYGDMNCRCRRTNGGQMRAWRCEAAQDAEAVCPADAMDGDRCTGQGPCAGQQCFCNNEQTNCF